MWVRASGAVLVSADGKPARIVGMTQNITERKRAEEALRESEEKYRTLFTSIGEGFLLGEAVPDADGGAMDFRYLEVNPAYERMTGIAKETVIGRTAREAIPNLEEEWYELVSRVGLEGETARVEQRAAVLD
ncbi:MAG: PAS domain S-box protein, partial [Acidobacteriota bacterium]|nr:PAS domain S-box protein [Acidobacteriota bacterium]